MSKYVSLAAAAAAATIVSLGATTAQAATLVSPSPNDYSLVEDTTVDGVTGSPFAGNDCTGVLGTDPQCFWDGSPMIAKFDFETNDDDELVITPSLGEFDSIDGNEFTFDFGEEYEFGFKWTYEADADDPGVTAFSVKGGNYFNVFEKGSAAFLGYGDFSDNWFPPIIDGDMKGLSHVVFYDTLTPIPVPAGLLLFLSGLAGIGVLGRYKAKRRELATV